MPLPIEGLGHHYETDPDAYFAQHELAQKVGIAECLLREAQRLLGTKGRLLDIGSGRGELLRVAREQGWDVVGIEPSQRFAEYASRYAGVEVHCAYLEECGLAESSFDAVILSGVLEHMYTPELVISEIARVLRTGGVLFIDVPNEHSLYARAGNLYQRLRGRDWVVNLSPTFSPYHVFGFGPQPLRRLLANHGLEVVKWRVFSGKSNLPARGGVMDKLERFAADVVSIVGRFGELGVNIQTWARKRPSGADA